ncbi:hypothetical protein P9222_24910 [Paenibacillus amylolyticus]|nr:hypothetical protein [Paenibacillus amylolyticus]WFR61615.1 hypothetical protein P9222_24910 [Paenibacillus amylolyticus]
MVCVLDLIVPKGWKRAVYGGFNILFSLVLFAATLYNVHFSSVPTYTALSELGQVAQVRGSIGPLVRPEHFLFFADIVLALPIWLIMRRRSGGRNRSSYRDSGLTFGRIRRRYWASSALRSPLHSALCCQAVLLSKVKRLITN